MLFASLGLLLLAVPAAGSHVPSGGPTAGRPAHPAVAGAPLVPATGAPATATAMGSAAWANVTASAGKAPPPRSYGRSFAFDPVDNYSVLFGGFGSGGGYLSDTWAFENGQWVALHPKTSPSARDHATLAWDPLDGVLVLFGGSGSSGSDSDTWTFLHGNWTPLSPASHPSARWASSLTWDAGDGYLLLFGGCSGAADGDTWTFVHGNWTQLHPTTSPSARENVALTYDPVDNYTVLFGGDDYYSNMDSDTWTFSAGNWTQLHPLEHPAARSEASIGWDPVASAIDLFGGSAATGTLGDTWTFVGGAWSSLVSVNVPAPREFGIMSADPAMQEMVLFSGAGSTGELDDTWVLYHLSLTAAESINSGVAPLNVSFNGTVNGARGALTWWWNLGDGNRSSTPSPSEIFGAAGLYFPTAQVTDANGSTAMASLAVSVGPSLTGTALVAPTTGTVPLTVECATVLNGGQPPYLYAWTSGSGNVSSNASPTFVYGAPGHYSLAVLVTDSLGKAVHQSFNITVLPAAIAPLVVGLTESVTSGPAPLTVYYGALTTGGVTPYRVTWQFGDGTTSTDLAPSHTFQAAGTFTTNLSVVDAKGTRHVDAVSITVGPGLWIRGAVTPAAVHLAAPVTFVGSLGGGLGPYTSFWDFGDGFGSGTLNTTHAYTVPGSYQATLTVVDSRGVSQTQNFSVQVSGAPSSPPPVSPTSPSSSGAGPSSLETLLIGLVIGVAATVGVIELLRRRGGRR